MIHVDAAKAAPEKPCFGRWLLAREPGKGSGSPVLDLAAAARLDRGFPKDGTPEQVSAHLNRSMADQDMHDAFEAAEAQWRAA